MTQCLMSQCQVVHIFILANIYSTAYLCVYVCMYVCMYACVGICASVLRFFYISSAVVSEFIRATVVCRYVYSIVRSFQMVKPLFIYVCVCVHTLISKLSRLIAQFAADTNEMKCAIQICWKCQNADMKVCM